MKITGPINFYNGMIHGTIFYVFSDIHISMLGKCKNENYDITDFLEKIFRENMDNAIDMYIENRYYLPGDTLFRYTKDSNKTHLVIPRIYDKFICCIDNNYCKCNYENVTFHNLDIRYGLKNGVYVQRNIYSVLKEIMDIDLYDTDIFKLFQEEFWKIFDYYFKYKNMDINSLKLVQLFNKNKSIKYEELIFYDEYDNFMSPIVFNMNYLSNYYRDKLIEWIYKSFEKIYEKLCKKMDTIDKIIDKLSVRIFDIYTLSKIMIDESEIKIIYMGATHTKTIVKFLEKAFNIKFNLSGNFDHESIISKIIDLKNSHNFYKYLELDQLLKDPNFINYINSNTDSFQCISI